MGGMRIRCLLFSFTFVTFVFPEIAFCKLHESRVITPKSWGHLAFMILLCIGAGCLHAAITTWGQGQDKSNQDKGGRKEQSREKALEDEEPAINPSMGAMDVRRLAIKEHYARLAKSKKRLKSINANRRTRGG